MTTSYLICPHCGKVCGEYETIIGEHSPQEGDIAICCHCTGVSIHISPTAARLPTNEEAEELLHDDVITAARFAILAELMW